MLITLDTPYADTTAADLSFALGLAEQPALGVLDLDGSGDRRSSSGPTVSLRLLGASHQVMLRTPVGEWVETVACLPGGPPRLPSSMTDDGYRFIARVLRLAPDEMSARAAVLRRAFAADPDALVGVFPGSPDAVTALHATVGATAITWRSWHAYPQTGEMVETETVVNLR
jgi:hypothetical protein